MDSQLTSLAALEEPVRRALYFHVRDHSGPVSRDQAARALRISRALAAFHLDKLVEVGLLEASFARLTDRRGPGAGRPSKLYRRSPRSIEISIPKRRYELAGELMAHALADRRSESAREALRLAARERGTRLGRESRGRGSPLTQAMIVLREAGFEPSRKGEGGLVLKNCPFDALARESRELVCGMNLALIQGILAGLPLKGVSAGLDPQPGKCCVALRLEEPARRGPSRHR